MCFLKHLFNLFGEGILLLKCNCDNKTDVNCPTPKGSQKIYKQKAPGGGQLFNAPLVIQNTVAGCHPPLV